ncbi:MAG: hypothetical protein EA404_13970 [Spirochaetaceae bacterium]|nr:MAG: hypothetical protein EA404_13970 [Spirochaetaceae bacterium]
MHDEALIAALADATLADAFEILSGAAEHPDERPELLQSLVNGLRSHRRWVSHMLAAHYLERAMLQPDGSPRTEQVPALSLELLAREYHRIEDSTLQTVFFRLSTAYRWPPPNTVLMHAANQLLDRTQRSAGRLDAPWRRLARHYFQAAALRPDPALARLIDEIRRALRDRELVLLARATAAAMFD